MLAEFSFLRHPILKVLRFGKIMVPGIERIDVIYFDDVNDEILARTLSAEMENPYGSVVEIGKEPIKSEIEKFRKKHKKFIWIDRKNHPWNPSKHENLNKSMHDEFESIILAIPVETSQGDNWRDVVFFYFNKNLSNLKFNASEEVSVDLKDFVGSAYQCSVNAIVQSAREDRDVWEDFAPLFDSNAQAIENLRMELKLMRKMYQERLVASCEFYLAKLSLQYGRKYSFSNGAKQQIKKYEGEYFKLENAIRAGVRIANNFQVHSETETLEIRESHLNFNTSRRIADIHDIHVQTEMEKPFNYLNQLEEIAATLRKNNQPVTGKNVAIHMNPPVQAPSITMYLNSHQEKILKLFGFYTDKWTILRTEFKPTFNILENAKNRPHQRRG
ncbi:MAG: hypothetical protein K9H16_16055 [Bacteroidales bacterium]|nr:hypothetical protein [Bacteroidales bacterium]